MLCLLQEAEPAAEPALAAAPVPVVASEQAVLFTVFPACCPELEPAAAPASEPAMLSLEPEAEPAAEPEPAAAPEPAVAREPAMLFSVFPDC